MKLKDEEVDTDCRQQHLEEEASAKSQSHNL
jgi:hypothetical protein